MPTTISRVASAAAILDHVKPGWAEIPDVENFNMMWTTTNICAHLDLPYDLDYKDPDAMATLVSLGLMEDDEIGWTDLNDAWMTAIFDRRTVSG